MYPHCTPVIASGTVVDPKVLLDEIDMVADRGTRPVTAPGVRQRPPGDALPPQARRHHRALPGQEPDRDHQEAASARRTPTSTPGSGSASRTCSTPRSSGTSSNAALIEKNKILSRVYNSLPMDPMTSPPSTSGTPSACRRTSPTRRCSSGRALEAGKEVALRGSPGNPARHRSRHLSVRHLVQPYGRGCGDRHRDRPQGDRRGDRRGQGLHLRVGTGPFPTELDDEVGRRDGRARAASTGR